MLGERKRGQASRAALARGQLLPGSVWLRQYDRVRGVREHTPEGNSAAVVECRKEICAGECLAGDYVTRLDQKVRFREYAHIEEPSEATDECNRAAIIDCGNTEETTESNSKGSQGVSPNAV